MMDPISPVIFTKIVEGMCSVINHVISVGEDRAGSKRAFLTLVMGTLSEINAMREELGDSLGPVDRDQYARYALDTEKKVERLRGKVFGKSAAERLYLKATKQHKRLTNKSNDIKRASLAVAKVPSTPVPGMPHGHRSADQAPHAAGEHMPQPAPAPGNVPLNVSNGFVNFGTISGPVTFAPAPITGDGGPVSGSQNDLAVQSARWEQLSANVREIREQLNDLTRAPWQHGVTDTPTPSGTTNAACSLNVSEELSARVRENMADATSLVRDVAEDLDADSVLEVIPEDDSESGDSSLECSDYFFSYGQ
ncbi:unnamed protein product [Peniophora sp. CBMAI 1063]|nr:unnamed protein product [Peniophora sp. CBMAI 1063]